MHLCVTIIHGIFSCVQMVATDFQNYLSFKLMTLTFISPPSSHLLCVYCFSLLLLFDLFHVLPS